LLTFLHTVCAFPKIFLTIVDPFAEEAEDSHQANYVHVRVQQRNGRKCLTTIQGLDPAFDFNRILKAFKKVCLPGELF